MPIALSRLEQASYQSAPTSVSTKSVTGSMRRVAFICHSHRDKPLVKGLVNLLKAGGFSPYVDWDDHELPPQPDRQTAARIQEVVRAADLFLFLATPNSMTSRWCPWEIGYADGVRLRSTILIVPTRTATGEEYGNEYLQLYRRVEPDYAGDLKFFEPGEYTSRPLAGL